MSDVSVLEFAHLNFARLTEFELDCALGYARLCYEQDLDRDLLRILVNTTHKRREQEAVILPMLAATVVKENVRLPWPATAEQIEAHQWKVRACIAAVMKTMSIRRVWQQIREKEKRERGEPIRRRPKPKQVEHPVEQRPDFENQLRLFS